MTFKPQRAIYGIWTVSWATLPSSLIFGAHLIQCYAMGGNPATIHRSFTLQIIDAQTSRPIPSAKLYLINPFGLRTEFAADERGRVEFQANMELNYTIPSVEKGLIVDLLGWRIEISHPSFDSEIGSLYHFVGNLAEASQRSVSPLVIRMHSRASTSEERILAEFVRGDAFLESSLLLGRSSFDALLSCPKICSDHIPWFESQVGSWTISDSTVTLSPTHSRTLEAANSMIAKQFSSRMNRVCWGDRNYLVSDGEMIDFCNAVNQGREPRRVSHGDFFLKRGDEAKRVHGLPNVGVLWSEYLLRTPLRAHVLELLPDSSARISAGTRQGLRRGMELVPEISGSFHEQVVISVHEDSAVVIAKYPNSRLRRPDLGDSLIIRGSVVTGSD